MSATSAPPETGQQRAPSTMHRVRMNRRPDVVTVVEKPECDLWHSGQHRGLLMRDCLTTEDHKFLADLGDAQRKQFDFILVDLFASPNQKIAAAESVPIWIDGEYVTAKALYTKITDGVKYSQIYEQWDARRHYALKWVAERLPPQDGRVLMVAAGYGSVCEEDLDKACGEAVSEAWNALYGEDD